MDKMKFFHGTSFGAVVRIFGLLSAKFMQSIFVSAQCTLYAYAYRRMENDSKKHVADVFHIICGW